MIEPEVIALGQALLSEVFKKAIPTIRTVVAAAGLDASQIPARSEGHGGMGSRAEIVPVIQHLFGELPLERQLAALPILAEKTLPQSEHLMHQHGFQYRDGTFIPVGLLDEREAHYLPRQSSVEISAAFDRLVRGDESGAITKACGAVDSLMLAIYEKNKWGRPPDSFQAKINTSLARLQIFETMEKELLQLAMSREDVRKIVGEVHEITKHAAEALQVIRRAMGDVHGSKPALRRTVYDSIKLASAICGLFEGQV